MRAADYSDFPQRTEVKSFFYLASDTCLEDTQASYSERLREKSRSITSANRPTAMSFNNYPLSRSNSKETLDNQSTNNHFLRPKSAGQTRAQVFLSPVRPEISNDFQSKRQFFENQTYTDYTPTSTNNKTYILSPSNTTMNNNNHQRHVTK